MEDKSIKLISTNSVHKICSGQVVLTLATAVKELVENSIDAVATVIEVKLKDYGSELIEVTDNGKGVKACDFQSITLKHHTSKLNDFSDIQLVSTFGFRGEALSSLCALSDVEIITCHSDSKIGTRIVYDHDGLIVEESPIHRQMGTTVIVKNLFYTLPVRHKEFHRHIRREYAKMLHMLMAYCLISIRKKICCTTVTKNGKRTIVFSSNSCESYRDNISCLFGKKQVEHLVELVQINPSSSDLEEFFLSETDLEKCNLFQIEGFVSSCCHGEGQNSSDRQFLFINGRPCDFPKVMKLINDVYHSFNKSQYPFVLLNIVVSEGSADVNVVPDKRKIFISEEKLLLCIMKVSLLHVYKLQPSEMQMSKLNLYFHPVSAALPQSSLNGDLHSNAVTNLDAGKELSDSLPLQKRNWKLKDVLLKARIKCHSSFSENLAKRKLDTSQTCEKMKKQAIEISSKCLKSEPFPELSAVEPVKVFIAGFHQRRKRIRVVNFNVLDLKEELGKKGKSKAQKFCDDYRKFRSKILPVENSSAEEELKKEIKKEDFSQMDIIGQFNLGFIIARLNNDLFIIDQHATDEKYNFETLQRNTVLETQKLLCPQKLDLTAAYESLLMDNLHVFEKSGFAFNIDSNNCAGNRVQLVSVPVSHSWNFGKEDVDEMLFMLTDNPVCSIRPSRVNQMFASRACRKSVMIGTALPLQTMKKLVFQMGELEQPWNCPHGRPTIRHLFNLTILEKI